MRLDLLLTAVLALPALAAAQTPGGFTAGQLALCSEFLEPGATPPGGVYLIDPLSGAVTKPYAYWSNQGGIDRACFDPWRDRLIFHARFTLAGTDELWAADAHGNLETLGYPGANLQCLAPTGDGRIFFRQPVEPKDAIRWIDAAGQEHLLQNPDGSVWEAPSTWWWRHMEYDPDHNALLIANGSFVAPCPGGAAPDVVIHRVDLSPDGTQVVGESCTSFTVDAGGSCQIVGLAKLDAASMLMVVDSNSNAEQPRLVRVQVDPLVATAYANTGHPGAAALVAGTYSHTRGQAVIVDGGGDQLRAYGAGGSGDGVEVSAPGSTAGLGFLLEVGPPSSPGGLSASGASSLSLAAGGSQAWSLDLGAGLAGAPYLILGSASGYASSFALDGVAVPLVLDAYTALTLTAVGTAPFTATLGLLDGTGAAAASLDLPAGTDSALAGIVLHHAALVFGPSLAVAAATNPVAVSLTP